MLVMLYILVCICFLKLNSKVITGCGERRPYCFVLLISKEMTSGSKTVRRAYEVGTTFLTIVFFIFLLCTCSSLS